MLNDLIYTNFQDSMPRGTKYKNIQSEKKDPKNVFER